MKEDKAKKLFIDKYEQTRISKKYQGLMYFISASGLLITVTVNWQGGIDWLYTAILAAIGLYGFFNLIISRKMPAFEKSPIGLYLSDNPATEGKGNSIGKDSELKVILILRSEDGKQAKSKYKATISFIESSGMRVKISFKGYNHCQTIISFIKSRMSDRCDILEMTFEEYRVNRKQYSASKR